MRYIDPKCKLCRRAGEKLFLRGDRCYSSKCAIVKRNFPPGAHGSSGAPRLTSFGSQLKEKQKIKRAYGLSEKQMKNYYLKAKKFKGDTASTLLQFLELRLDNIVYRLGFAKSRSQARQIVSHRHILLNNKLNNIASAQTKVESMVAIKPSSVEKPLFKSILAGLEKHETMAWLKVNTQENSGQIIKKPTTEDVKQNFDVRAVIEFYSR